VWIFSKLVVAKLKLLLSCAMVMSPPVAVVLFQRRRAPRLCHFPSQRPYFNHVFCHGYVASGRSSSTSTMSCAATSPSGNTALPRLCCVSGHTALPLDLLSCRTGSTLPTSCVRSCCLHRSTCCLVALSLLLLHRASSHMNFLSVF
jgi:hypothetical protein